MLRPNKVVLKIVFSTLKYFNGIKIHTEYTADVSLMLKENIAWYLVLKRQVYPSASLETMMYSPFLQIPPARSGGITCFAGSWPQWGSCASLWLTSTTAWTWWWRTSSHPVCSIGTTPWPMCRYTD